MVSDVKALSHVPQRCTLVRRREVADTSMAQDDGKPIPTRAQLIANLKKAAATRKQRYEENQAPPPSRPDPSQDAPRPDVGNRGW